jgi:hypothetical protein
MDRDPLFIRAEKAMCEAAELLMEGAAMTDGRGLFVRRRSDPVLVSLMMSVHPYIVENWLTISSEVVRSMSALQETILEARMRRRGRAPDARRRIRGGRLLAGGAAGNDCRGARPRCGN